MNKDIEKMGKKNGIDTDILLAVNDQEKTRQHIAKFNNYINKPMKPISPALINDLHKVLIKYGYGVLTANLNKNNHRYIYTDNSFKLLIELSDFKP